MESKRGIPFGDVYRELRAAGASDRELDHLKRWNAAGFAEGPMPVTLLGDPATLYVCSDDAQLVTDRDIRRVFIAELIIENSQLDGSEVVTGSTAPRVPLSAEAHHAVMVGRVRHLRIADANLDGDAENDYHWTVARANLVLSGVGR